LLRHSPGLVLLLQLIPCIRQQLACAARTANSTPTTNRAIGVSEHSDYTYRKVHMFMKIVRLHVKEVRNSRKRRAFLDRLLLATKRLEGE